MLFLLLLRRGLLFKRVNNLVMRHVDEHLTTCLHILSLDHEAFLRLDRSPTLRVNNRLAIGAFARRLCGHHFIEHRRGLWTHLSRLDLLVNLHQLGIGVLL